MFNYIAENTAKYFQKVTGIKKAGLATDFALKIFNP